MKSDIACYDEAGTPQELRKRFKNFAKATKRRFLYEFDMYSFWFQANVLDRLGGKKILEIGPGGSVTKPMMLHLGYTYHTLDAQKTLKPEILANFDKFKPGRQLKAKYDTVCAFQVLEHMPYEHFITNLKKMSYMSRKYVVVSLPRHCKWFRFDMQLPSMNLRGLTRFLPKKLHRFLDMKFIPVGFLLRFNLRARQRRYRKEYMKEFPYAVHHFEIGRGKTTLKRVLADIKKSGLKCNEHFHDTKHPIRYFFICEK